MLFIFVVLAGKLHKYAGISRSEKKTYAMDANKSIVVVRSDLTERLAKGEITALWS